MKKYIVHPGRITSKTDGDSHYIGFAQLVGLYRVKRSECCDATSSEYLCYRRRKDMIDLYPKYNGDYTIPK